MASASSNTEEVPLSDFNDGNGRHQRGSELHRAHTDAHDLKYRPQLRVQFHTLGEERKFSDTGLLSATAHHIGRANWSGGWQNTIITQRRKGYLPASEEEEVTEITDAMERDYKLMADDVDGEVLRRDALRELTKSLRVRKEIKQRLTHKRSASDQMSCYKSFKYSMSMKWFNFKEEVRNTLRDMALWHKDLKCIEGIYGTSVGSYFRFLRYLFLLNLLMTFIVVGFLFIPQKLYDKYYEEEYATNTSAATETGRLHIMTDDFTMKLRNGSSVPGRSVVVPTTTSIPYTSSLASGTSFRSLDWLTGAGWFQYTELYYGGYVTETFRLFNSSMEYDMSQAYLFTILVCFAFYLMVLLYRVFQMYKLNYIDTEEDVSVAFVEKIFTAWDFNITDEKAARVKHRSIYNELIELLQEYQDEEEIESFVQRIYHRVVRVVMWFILICFLAVLGFALYILLKDELFQLAENETNYFRTSLKLLIYPFVVTLLMIIIPVVFESVGRFERYSKPRYELYATVTRVTLLEWTILSVLVFFWYAASPGLREELDNIGPEHGELDSNKTQNNTVQCWENVLGEEIYRLVIIDFLVILISVLLVDTSKKFLVQKGKATESLQQFGIATNILHIIYNQTLLWAGIFFCPMLPLMISMKFFIIFYLQKFNVTKNHEPVERPWRASQAETLFYALTLISAILCFFSFGFILVRGYSSPSCGAFQGYTHYLDIVWTVSDESHKVLIRILSFLLKPACILLLIVILGIVLYCIKNTAEGRSELAKVLRKQLEIEMKDRVFLQRLIEKVHRGDYVPGSPRSGLSSPLFSIDDEEARNISKRTSFIFSRSKDDGDTS